MLNKLANSKKFRVRVSNLIKVTRKPARKNKDTNSYKGLDYNKSWVWIGETPENSGDKIEDKSADSDRN